MKKFIKRHRYTCVLVLIFILLVILGLKAKELLVPDEELIYNYVSSFSDEYKQLLIRDREAFIQKICDRKNEEGFMYIHKSYGVVVCVA